MPLLQLLQRDVRSRLGTKYTNGLEGIKSHPWFMGIDWEKLANKELRSPFEPDVRTSPFPFTRTISRLTWRPSILQSKKANFDATHELEELLLEDNPLKARKRNPNLDVNQMSADMRMMEENFTIYDHAKQPRRTHFEKNKDIGTTTQSSADPSTSGIPLEDQPFAEMTSRAAPSVHARSIAGMDEKDLPRSPTPRSPTPRSAATLSVLTNADNSCL